MFLKSTYLGSSWRPDSIGTTPFTELANLCAFSSTHHYFTTDLYVGDRAVSPRTQYTVRYTLLHLAQDDAPLLHAYNETNAHSVR